MEIRDQILSRMYVVMTLIAIIPFLIVIQLFKIYWFDGQELRTRGEQQATLYETVPAMRGAILDRNGHVLAGNEARYDLMVNTSTEGFEDKKAVFVQKIAKMFDRHDEAHYYLLLRNGGGLATIAQKLSEEQKQTIDSWHIPGVVFQTQINRRYNYQTIASQVVGYVAPKDETLVGMIGIEYQQDVLLSGKNGRRPMQKDRSGNVRPVPGAYVVPPEHGGNVVLTLDLARQTIMEEELLKGVAAIEAKWGTAIAVDPHTGEILAMANVPSLDSNNPLQYPETAQTNHAVQSKIEPGSTFKMVTAIAAVDQDIVQLKDSVEVGRGTWRFGDRVMRDDHVFVKPKIVFADVIAESSNIGTAKTASRLEPGVFYQYARNLGFGQFTMIDLPLEAKGNVKRPRKWSGTTQPWMSTGYEVDVSPLQLVMAFSTLANGGKLMKPYIVSQTLDVSGQVLSENKPEVVRQVYQPETAKKLLPAFERVVERGTARSAYVEGLRIIGKTGTAKKVVNGKYIDSAYRASFVGMFPADNPVVAMVVILDEPQGRYYGGDVAAPIFKRIAQRWIGTFPEVATRMAPPEALPQQEGIAVPNVLGLPASVAFGRLATQGLVSTAWQGEELIATVKAQQPSAGNYTLKNDPVTLTLNEKTNLATLMPDLRGLSVRQAVNWMNARGVKVRIKGKGIVRQQNPVAGEPLSEYVTLQCR